MLWLAIVLFLVFAVLGFSVNHLLWIGLVIALGVWLYDRGRGTGAGTTTL